MKFFFSLLDSGGDDLVEACYLLALCLLSSIFCSFCAWLHLFHIDVGRFFACMSEISEGRAYAYSACTLLTSRRPSLVLQVFA